ncbi:STAS domain-containing protein [Streptomyces sp. Act143]|uniref:STAS domain-containing protein n=1 Tax=Streptomyces sp. Act143 TaxID=2200760 RepID=UPI0015E80EAF|nr:STAS domain-containing protein [Streptomyces sp. Act143]
MNSTSTPPILTAPAGKAVAPTEQGADAAPGHILTLSCTTSGAHTLHVALAGEADHFSSRPLRTLLVTAAVHGYRTLILDCHRLKFADGALLSALDGWHRRGGHVRIEHPPPQLRLLLAAEARRRPARTGRRASARQVAR